MRLAIFGGGSIGTRHALNAKRLGCEVEVFDVDRTRGNAPYRFEPETVDAVLICTPAPAHEQTAHGLLYVGYRGPLFVEKPLTLRTRATVFHNWPHAVTMVGYNWRFHPEIAPLRTFAQKGATFHFDCRTDIRTWPGVAYGDPLLECSHEIDLACHWLGDPTTVHGGALNDAGAWAQMEHPRGHSIIDVRWHSEPVRRIGISLPGGVHVRADELAWRHVFTGGETPAFRESYVAELRHFLNAVRSGQPTSTPFVEGLRVVEICERVKELAN